MERVRGFDRATQSISCCRVTLIVYPRRFKAFRPQRVAINCPPTRSKHAPALLSKRKCCITPAAG
jgi:hypothetical protein